MKRWQCTVCGYIHKGDEPPEKCPVCGADKSLFKLMEEATEQSGGPEPARETPSGVTKWRCTVCGYIHKGEEPPEQCPVCGADKSKFVPYEEEKEEEKKEAEPSTEESDSRGKPEQTNHPASSDLLAKIQAKLKEAPYKDIMQMLTKYHGHPIAVHIPNGLLPICVLFTFFAVMFGSANFAVAARYNTCFVALIMPLVIATGLVDWQNRFNNAITQVFKVKFACAGIVTFLSLVLAFWWIGNPDLYLQGVGGNLFFLLLNLLNLTAAIVAGWYGGKLVFHN